MEPLTKVFFLLLTVLSALTLLIFFQLIMFYIPVFLFDT